MEIAKEMNDKKKFEFNEVEDINTSKPASLVLSTIRHVVKSKLNNLSPDFAKQVNVNTEINPVKIEIILKRKPINSELRLFEEKAKRLAGDDVKFSYVASSELKRKTKQEKEISSSELIKHRISLSLPKKFELINHWIIGIPLKKGSHKFILCSIQSEKRDDPDLEKWRTNFEDEHGIQVIIRHNWSKAALKKLLKDFSGGETLLTNKSLTAIHGTKKLLFGKKHKSNSKPITPEWVNLSSLLDMTNLPFITLDAQNVKDREDAVHCEYNQNGDIDCYLAISESSKMISPESACLKTARKLYSNIYYRSGVRTIIPKDIAFYFSSLLPDQTRRAFVRKYTFDGQNKTLKNSKLFWANIKTSCNIPPDLINDCINENISIEHFTKKEKDSPVNEEVLKSLSLLSEIQPALKQKIKRGKKGKVFKPIMTRFKDIGSGAKIVSTLMINYYSDMAEFFEENKIPYIAKNQSYPNKEFIDLFRNKLLNLEIQTKEEDFQDGFKLFGLIEELNRKGLYRFSDLLVDKYLLKTTYSSKSLGFAAFNGLPYMDFKSRTFPGLINSMNLVAFFSKIPFPFDEKKIEKEVKAANKGRSTHKYFRYIGGMLNGIEYILQHCQEIYKAEVIEKNGSQVKLAIPNFFTNCVSDIENLEISEQSMVNVELLGYDIEDEAIKFKIL